MRKGEEEGTGGEIRVESHSHAFPIVVGVCGDCGVWLMVCFISIILERLRGGKEEKEVIE